VQIYVVKPGDTLYSIGRALSLAPGFLARYNGLREPYRLAVGQSLLVLYPERTVTVRRGMRCRPSQPRPGRMCCRYSG